MHAKTIAFQLELCAKVLEKNIGDVSHEESLVVPGDAGAAAEGHRGDVTRSARLPPTLLSR